MPPKPKEKGKGKTGGKTVKDIMPPGAKPPRDPLIAEPIQVEEPTRIHELCPNGLCPLWPNEEELLEHDFELESTEEPFTDSFEMNLPASFKAFQKHIQWLRPREFLQLIAEQKEAARFKEDRKCNFRVRKARRMSRALGLGTPSDNQPTISPKEEHQPIQFEVIIANFIEREETPDEAKKRKVYEEEREKTDKAAKKKPPPAKGKGKEEEEIRIIKEVKLENLDLGDLLPLYSKWASSQFQFVKDGQIVDSETEEAMWKRIYPQVEGVPVYNPHGKYWVKLHHMGQQRLVEIDDRMPCDPKRRVLFPHSVNAFEIWPLLLLKAHLKLYSYLYTETANPVAEEVGDPSIVHSLTGLIPERIEVGKFQSDKWALLRRLLSDDHYFGNKVYISAYCLPDFKPSIPSIHKYFKMNEYVGEKPQGKEGGGVDQSRVSMMETSSMVDGDNGPLTGISKMGIPVSGPKTMLKMRKFTNIVLSVTAGKKMKENQKERAAYILTGFSYALHDIFDSDIMDMNFVIKEDREKLEEYKSPFSPRKRRTKKHLSKEEKDEMRKKRKEMMSKLDPSSTGGIDSRPTMRFGKKQIKRYQFIKVKTSVANYPIMNVLCPFTNEEIELAKKCILNKWDRPPDYDKKMSKYYEEMKKAQRGEYKKSFHSTEKSLADAQEEGKEVTPRPLEESKIEESKVDDTRELEALEPRQRTPGGLWMEASDFPYCFQYLLVYHHPGAFQNKLILSDLWADKNNTFISNEEETHIIVEEGEKQEIVDESMEGDISKNSFVLKSDELDERTKLLVCFAPNGGKPLLPDTKIPNFSFVLHKPSAYSNENSFDLTNIQSSQLLKFVEYLSGSQINLPLPDDKDILMPVIYAPFGYTLWVLSNYAIKKMSKEEHLCAHENYTKKEFDIEYPDLQCKRYHLFFKFNITVEEPTKVYFNYRMEDRYLLPYLRLKLIDRNQCKAGENINIGVTETGENCSRNLGSNRSHWITLSPNEEMGYILLLEGILPYSIKGDTFKLSILSDKESLNAEQMELEEPMELGDVYVPYKYGNIFQERVWIGDEATISLHLRLRHGGTYISASGGKDDKKAGAPKGKGTTAQVDDEEIIPETDLRPNRLINFMLFDDDLMVYSTSGYNQLTISHLVLRANQGLPEKVENSNEEHQHKYLFVCNFCKCDWPECVNVGEETENLGWIMKIFTNNTMAIGRDTTKEDNETAIRQSWEANEPGRQEKALKSRQHFLLLQKKLKGEELTEEEEEILKEPRERKRKEDMEAAGAGGPAKKGGKAPPPKAGKAPPGKGAKGGKGTEEAVEKKEEVREPPSAENHKNAYITEFLEHAKRDRLIVMEASLNMPPSLRSPEEKDQIDKERNAKYLEYENKLNQMNEEREKKKIEREEYKKTSEEQAVVYRTQLKENKEILMKKRNDYRDLILNRKEKENALLTLITQEKIDYNTLEKAIEEAKEKLVKESSIMKGLEMLEKLKYSKGFEDNLAKAVQEKNWEEAKRIYLQVIEEKLPIDPKIMADCKNNLVKQKMMDK